MATPRLITVYGATGSQGGSVIASLLENKTSGFALRGTTRRPESCKAADLKSKGVEVVKADGFVESQAVDAFKGSWAVFINTNSDDPALSERGAPTERQLGKSLVDAAAEAGVEHLIYSGLASASIITKGAMPNECFDDKYAISEYAKSIASFKSVTIVIPGWYLENHLFEEMAPFCGGFPFNKDDEGYLTLRLPRWGGSDEIPFVSVSEDFGDFVHGVLLTPEKYHGKFVQAFSVSAKPQELVTAFEKGEKSRPLNLPGSNADFFLATGKKSRFAPIEDWRTMETFGAKEYITIRDMFGFLQLSDGLYYGRLNDTTDAKHLKAAAAEAKGKDGKNTALTTLESFVDQHFGQ